MGTGAAPGGALLCGGPLGKRGLEHPLCEAVAELSEGLGKVAACALAHVGSGVVLTVHAGEGECLAPVAQADVVVALCGNVPGVCVLTSYWHDASLRQHDPLQDVCPGGRTPPDLTGLLLL